MADDGATSKPKAGSPSRAFTSRIRAEAAAVRSIRCIGTSREPGRALATPLIAELIVVGNPAISIGLVPTARIAERQVGTGEVLGADEESSVR